MVEYNAPQLDAVFGAMSDPTRRAIIARLAEGDTRVTDIASHFPVSLNAISKHIKALEQAGLVQRTVSGREHTLSLSAAPMADAVAWMAHYRAFWDDSLAGLDEFIAQRKGRKGPPR